MVQSLNVLKALIIKSGAKNIACTFVTYSHILLLGSTRAGRQACPVGTVSPAGLPGQPARSAQPGPAGLARPGRLIVGRLPALVVDRNPAR